MTKAETAELLALITAFDRRTTGQADVEAWHLVLGDLDPQDCAEAVRDYFATSREWLMPADIRTRAVNAARRRAALARQAELDAQMRQENPPAEITDRKRPLLALMSGSPVKSAPRPDWNTRHGKVPLTQKPAFTAEELEAARRLLDESKPEAS